MNYEYNSQGDIKFFGCPIVFIRRLYPTKFAVGDIVYVLKKARLGILEKVAIKKVNLNLNTNEPIFIYKDTFNSLHNEEDLCGYIEAKQEIEYFKNLSFRECGISEYLVNSTTQ